MLDPWSNIKVQLTPSDGDTPSGDLYAKVMGAAPGDHPGFTLHFTSIPPDAAAFFERLLASSASDDKSVQQ